MANVQAAWRTREKIEQEREAQAWASLRAERNRRLADTDWIMLPDAPVPPGTSREQWAAYRQALRDMPQQPGAPYDVTWPEPPVSEGLQQIACSWRWEVAGQQGRCPSMKQEPFW